MQAARALRGGIPSAAWRVARLAVLTTTLALVVFHIWLFWNHLEGGRLADPLTAAKWVGSGLLALALVAGRHRGISVFHGRRAVVLWTLAALIHVGAMTRVAPSNPGDLAQGLMYVVPAAVGALFTTAALIAVAVANRSRPTIRYARVLYVAPRRRCRPVFIVTGPGALRAPPFGSA